jgi:spoIIIJ-associated protein
VGDSPETDQSPLDEGDASPKDDGAAESAADEASTTTTQASRRRGREGEGDEAGRAGAQGRPRRLEGIADYLEELLDIADLDGDLDMDVEGERAWSPSSARLPGGRRARRVLRAAGPTGWRSTARPVTARG